MDTSHTPPTQQGASLVTPARKALAGYIDQQCKEALIDGPDGLSLGEAFVEMVTAAPAGRALLAKLNGELFAESIADAFQGLATALRPADRTEQAP
jgi:hypothetical protein